MCEILKFRSFFAEPQEKKKMKASRGQQMISMTMRSSRVTTSPVMTTCFRLKRSYSVQTMTVNQYSKILNSNARGKYQIVDVREPDELNSFNVQDNDIMNLPISQSWKWGTDIARHQHPLDPVKPVICVVSCCLIFFLLFSFDLYSAVLVGEV
jgi:hypothetical protein